MATKSPDRRVSDLEAENLKLKQKVEVLENIVSNIKSVLKTKVEQVRHALKAHKK